jgi:peptide/nickel transport system substrate-binding protein
MLRRKARVTALLFLVGAVVLSSCGTPAAQPTEEAVAPTAAPAETEAPAAATATTRCIRVANPDTSGQRLSLDPINQPTSESSLMVYSVYNGLVDADSNFQVQPELAESWESNADATEWTFHLRHGVMFHDGHELTSADVVYTFKRLIDPTAGSEAAPILSFLSPEGIIAVDTYTVKFVTAAPVVNLPLLITGKNELIIPDGATPETLGLNGVGTGPWIPVDFQPDQVPHRFVRNPNYWEPGLPKADCLEFYYIPEPTARSAAILAGEVDVVWAVDFSTLPSLQNNPNVVLNESGASTSIVLAIEIDQPPFDDNRVRQALKMVIDRPAMVQTALLGFGEVGDDNTVPPSWPDAWRHEVPARDVEGAKQLLAEAGYGPSNPLKIDLYSADYYVGALGVAQLFEQQAKDAGIEVNLITSPAGNYWDNVWMKQPFFGSAWTIRPAAMSLPLVFRSNSVENETHWFNPEFDALLDQANTTADAAARTKLLQQAAQMLTEEGGEITPVFTHLVSAVSSKCTGFTSHVQVTHFKALTLECK